MLCDTSSVPYLDWISDIDRRVKNGINSSTVYHLLIQIIPSGAVYKYKYMSEFLACAAWLWWHLEQNMLPVYFYVNELVKMQRIWSMA